MGDAEGRYICGKGNFITLDEDEAHLRSVSSTNKQ